MNFSLVLLLLIGSGLTQGVFQQIELYSELNQGGANFTWKDKLADLKDWKLFLADVKSYCVIGKWSFFTETNFDGMLTSYSGGGTGAEERRCGNSAFFPRFNSARFRGPQDTGTVGISIYEGITGSVIGGTEVVVDGRTATHFPMNKTVFVVAHGRSSWTLFTEDNFGGSSWCFRSSGLPHAELALNSSHPVRSVVRDCIP